tara:strand:+ start:1246 stop:1950 length:705 start_codon:yes stop_codon:yes gene_type:complete
MSAIDRQKRMTNLLLAGNLATNYKSTKILGEMRNIQSQQLQTDQKRNVELQKQSRLQEESLRQQRQENLIRQQKLNFEEQKHKKAENEIKKTKLMREVFFLLSEELTDVKNSKKHNLEKYFILASIKTNLMKYKISSEMTDDFQEKKIIKDFINDLDDYSDNIWNNLKENEKNDHSIILDILEVNEEEKIKDIKNSEDYKNYIKLQKEIDEIDQCKDLHLLIKGYKKEISKLKE